MSRTLYLSRLRQLLTREGDSFFDALRSRHGWRPREVEIRLTWACNALCVMCGLDHYLKTSDTHYKKQVPVERLLEVITELADSGCESILFSGGEVTLVKELPNILAHTSKLGISSQINSHGGRLTEDYCDKLLDSGLNGIMISLDAADAELHDSIRNLPGLFETAVKGVSYLRRKRPDQSNFYMLINTVIMKNNYRQLPDLVKLASESGIGEINFSPLSIDNTWDDWATGKVELKLSDAEEAELATEIFPKVMEIAKKGKISVIIPAVINSQGLIEIQKSLFNATWVNCAVAHYHCVINVNGDVFPCCYASPQRFSMGNIMENSFTDIWNGEEYSKFRNNCFPAKFEMCVSCSQHRNENELIQRWFDRQLKTRGEMSYEKHH